MAKLTIVRTNQYTNRFRKIHIYMDNKMLGKISNNQTLTFDVEPGQHQFFAQTDWLSSATITLNFEPDTTKQLELGSPLKQSPLYRTTLVILFFGSIFLQRAYHDDKFFGVGFGILIVLEIGAFLFAKQKPAIYYLTWGRKKYIYLKEI